MPRDRFRTYTLPRDEVEPGLYHAPGAAQDAQCCALTESDDGCPACQEEMDEATDLIAKQRLEDDYEIRDIILVNDPWSNQDEAWEFEVTERKV